MKYLDAKRKLIFMMATLRYLKLLIKEETMVTEDTIRTLVKDSLPIIFPDLEISTTDFNEVTSGIWSVLIKTTKNEINVKDSLKIEGYRLGQIHIADTNILEDALKTITSLSSYLNIDSNSSLNELLKVVANNDTVVNINSNIKLNDAHRLKDLYSDLVKINNEIITQNTLKFKSLNSTLFNMREEKNLKLTDALVMEISNLQTIPFVIVGKSELSDAFKTKYDMAIKLLSKNNLQVYDTNNIQVDNTKLIKGSTYITLNDYLSLKAYRYTILREKDPDYMDDFRSSTILNNIYTER